MAVEKQLNERLANFMLLDVHSILKSAELTKEYEALHLLIEGFKPSCTGCSAKNKLASWKKKYNTRKEVKHYKPKNMNNTFKLKKQHPRLSIPFTGSVITQSSSDELALFYLNQEITKEEKERRESFFELLPKNNKKIVKKGKEKVPKIKEEEQISISEKRTTPIQEVHKEIVKNNMVISDLDAAKTVFQDTFNTQVPNRYKNNLEWILKKVGKAKNV